MRVLAVDTSTNVAAVAIIEDGILIAENICNKGKTHSQRLMPMIKTILDTVEMKASDMDAFSAAVGPGSFTGLRIGVTTVKGLAFAVQKPVISIPTLDALAYNIPCTNGLICPMLDARNSQVYTAIFRVSAGKLERLTEYLGVHVGELCDKLRDMEDKVTFLGDACVLHKNYIVEQLGNRADFATPNVAMPKASSVAQLAYYKLLAGEEESCFDMVPFYLRKSQAEREAEIKKEAGIK